MTDDVITVYRNKLNRPFYSYGGSESEVDLVLLYNVNQFILMVTSIFQGQFP